MHGLIQVAEPVVGGLSEVAMPGWVDRFPMMAMVLGLILLFLVAGAALLVVQRGLLRLIARVTRQTSAAWDEVLFDGVVLKRLGWLVPVLIVRAGVHLVPHLPATAATVIDRVAVAVMILVVVRSISAALDVINTIYNRFPTAADRPIKGMLQVVSIVIHFVGGDPDPGDVDGRVADHLLQRPGGDDGDPDAGFSGYHPLLRCRRAVDGE